MQSLQINIKHYSCAIKHYSCNSSTNDDLLLVPFNYTALHLPYQQDIITASYFCIQDSQDVPFSLNNGNSFVFENDFVAHVCASLTLLLLHVTSKLPMNMNMHRSVPGT